MRRFAIRFALLLVLASVCTAPVHALGPGDFATRQAATDAKVATINYGVFINAVIDFVIVAFVIFLLIRAMNRLKKKDEAPPAAPTTKACPQCLMDIPLQAKRCGHCTSEVRAA